MVNVGFVKDQIRIIAESRGILRVRGERFLCSNKWSRFQEEVVVPEDCNMSEIRAKFEGGILQITMPKKVTPMDQKHPFEEQSSKITEPPRSSVRSPNEQPKPQGFQEAEPSSKPPALPAVSHAPTNPPFLLPPRQPQNLHSSPMKPPPSVLQNNEDNVSQHFPDYNNIDSSKESNKGMPTSLIKENEPKKVGPKKDEDVYADAFDQEQSSKYDLNKIDKFGHPLLKRLDENRQLLMNMGVAVLVIVALGAHIVYSFAPSE